MLHREDVQEGLSYLSGGTLIGGAVYADLTNGLHLAALFLGVLMVAVQLIYRVRKMIRNWNKDEEE